MKIHHLLDELLNIFIPYVLQLVVSGEIAKVLGRPSARNRVEHSVTIFFRAPVQGEHTPLEESFRFSRLGRFPHFSLSESGQLVHRSESGLGFRLLTDVTGMSSRQPVLFRARRNNHKKWVKSPHPDS
jgi:hypothetical protein